jgi:hypothetical protein
VACLAVVACANLAGLLLARNTTRHKEIAMRLALDGDIRQPLVHELFARTVGFNVHEEIPEKAAAYGFFIAEGQPFVDGTNEQLSSRWNVPLDKWL